MRSSGTPVTEPSAICSGLRRPRGRSRKALLATHILAGARSRLREAATRVEGLARLARELSPQRVLHRGFSITRDAQGTVVRQAAQVTPGDRLLTELAEGTVTSVAEESESP